MSIIFHAVPSPERLIIHHRLIRLDKCITKVLLKRTSSSGIKLSEPLRRNFRNFSQTLNSRFSFYFNDTIKFDTDHAFYTTQLPHPPARVRVFEVDTVQANLYGLFDIVRDFTGGFPQF